MTQLTPSAPFPVPYPGGPRTTFPAAAAPIVVEDPLCGHLPGERHDGACEYWRGVALGEYPSPDGLLPHLPGLLPLTDPALGGVPC
ncbi:hypothetical protein [Micromonospora sp. WMMC250]|uniref:hypothetical protein n=1 Tax=Micromonospora sp. WMMC250 TaxID=3014781 RepID=UPI0022B6D44B|nr:hypothetical protein [Micromonospora sp. WMMC250]MCZ7376513.1 hypothetical protein [Micromonospora sp. WMMC250]